MAVAIVLPIASERVVDHFGGKGTIGGEQVDGLQQIRLHRRAITPLLLALHILFELTRDDDVPSRGLGRCRHG